MTVTAGAAGATLLRWELAGGRGELSGAGAASSPLAHPVELGDPGGYLMRCDRVDFPLGGIAYSHVHRGAGIRCLLAGGIRVEVSGKGHDIVPGGAWFEAGPDPVLALASNTALTAFARVMILPRELKGKSSIRYVKAEDADKPKTQQYQVFCDEFDHPMKHELKARTGAQLLVDQLKVHGVDTAFCVPGESYLAVLDALYDARETIHLIVCRQDGGAAYMAEAYGKLDRPAGHLLRHARPGRDASRDRRAHRVPGFHADDPVHRPGGQRLRRPRGVPGGRLPAHVRADGEMGRRRSTAPTASPST